MLILIGLASSVFSTASNIVRGQSPDFAVPCQIETYGDAWDGLITFGLFNTSATPFNFTVYNSYLVIMKTNGTLQHLRQTSNFSYLFVKSMGPHTLMFQGEPERTTHFWNFKSNNTIYFPNVYGHHDVEYNPISNTFLTLRYYEKVINGSQIIFDKIVEEDANGNILWNWDTYDHIPLSDADLNNHVGELNGQPLIDFTHANAIQWDYNQNVVYLNLRHTNTFYKINMTTGDVIWACGEHGNFTLLDANGNNVTTLWYHSHATWQVEPNVFTMFDNDFDNTTNPSNCHSRMIEVTLNEQNKTAWVSWSWEAQTNYWSPYFGKTDRLPNGDHIAVLGSPTHQFPQNLPWTWNDTGAVIVEVNSTGAIVRKWIFPTGWSIYRIDKIVDQPQIPEFDFDSLLNIFAVATAVVVPAIMVSGKIFRSKRTIT